uniref:Uncharacterized protein n=1 Tax=Caenorhabditis japonica TaxID=281687 RepID=A0A8R1EBR5_CAEJA
MIYPYHTPIDTLHNLGEGFFETISKEVTGIPSNTNPKSQLFNANKNLIKNALERIIIPSVFGELSARRNGSDKIHYFRLLLGLLAITTDFLSPKARIVIAASSTIANGMYTESQGLELILDQMCAATRWFLSETSPEYMTIKTHEVLCHLPEITRLMGNTSCLSTFQFESAYKFILKGYTSSMTRGRLEHLGSKFIVHKEVRRELAHRALSEPSEPLRRFISKCPGLFSTSISWNNSIAKFDDADKFPHEDLCRNYSSLSVGVLKLVSRYGNSSTKDDFFYAKMKDGVKRVYRFVAAVVLDGTVSVRVEKVKEVDINSRFMSLELCARTLDGTDLYYGLEVVKHLRGYCGIAEGYLSGEREFVDIDDIIGMAAYVPVEDNFIFLNANGCPVHN